MLKITDLAWLDAWSTYKKVPPEHYGNIADSNIYFLYKQWEARARLKRQGYPLEHVDDARNYNSLLEWDMQVVSEWFYSHKYKKKTWLR